MASAALEVAGAHYPPKDEPAAAPIASISFMHIVEASDIVVWAGSRYLHCE